MSDEFLPSPGRAMDPYDGAVLIRWDNAADRPIYELGDMDPYVAITMLRIVADHLEAIQEQPISAEELAIQEAENNGN